jgi:class 3 adenylate cyclase
MLTTDGIESGFTSRALEDRPAQEMAESILARFGTIADDAHVVVVRYVGAAK